MQFLSLKFRLFRLHNLILNTLCYILTTRFVLNKIPSSMFMLRMYCNMMLAVLAQRATNRELGLASRILEKSIRQYWDDFYTRNAQVLSMLSKASDRNERCTQIGQILLQKTRRLNFFYYKLQFFCNDLILYQISR